MHHGHNQDRNHDYDSSPAPEELLEIRFVGGCIVPVMFHPRTRLPLVLLAAETKRTRLGRCFNEWDAFGGKVEPEETVEYAAAREFMEESMGVIELECMAGERDDAHTVDTIARCLTTRQYLARVDLSYLRKREPVPRFTVYSLFFVAATWDTEVPARFATLRKDLLRARTILKALRPPPVFADEPSPQFLFDGDKWTNPENGNTYRVCFVVDAGIVATGRRCGYQGCIGGYHRNSACTQRLTHATGVATSLLVTRADANAEADSDGDDEPIAINRFVACSDARPAKAYVDWVQATVRARLQLQTIPPAVRNHRAALSDRIQAAYLEKRVLRYMTLPQILDAHGSSRGTLLPPGLSTAVTSRLKLAVQTLVRTL